MLPDRVALDREKLNFFVAGPGPGEGLAIALPRPTLGWIFIDGCKTNTGQYPLHKIWERYRLDGEATEGIVLTHPHKDHYAGMVELIDLTAPRWLACVATHHRAEVQALRDDPVVEDYPGLLAGTVKDVLSRIQRAWDWNLAERVELRAGKRLPIERTDLTIDVVAPDPAGTRQFFVPAGLSGRLRRRANELSAVLHVRYGTTRLVLGGDLPELDNGAGPRTGWTKVLESYPDVPGSHVLKVPHHASDGAMHSGMMGAGVASAGARWVVTPFQGGPSRPLPQLTTGRGIDVLLEGIDQVHLTSLPTGWTTREPLDAPIPLDAIVPPVAMRITGATFKSRAGLRPSGVLDAVWLFALDAAGQCVAEHRGDEALVLTPRRLASTRPMRHGPPVQKKAARRTHR